MTSNIPATTGGTKSLSIATRDNGLPDLTPATVRKASWSTVQAKDYATAVGEVQKGLTRIQGEVLLSAALVLYGAIRSGHVGGKGVPQKDYAAAMGQDQTTTSRLVTIGKGVVDWRVKPGTRRYTALVDFAYAKGDKSQKEAIREALKGDPEKSEDRAKFDRALDAYLAGPPKDATPNGDNAERGSNREGGSGEMSTEDRVHTQVKSLKDVVTVIGALGNVIGTLTPEDQAKAAEALDSLSSDITARLAETVPGEVVSA